MKPTDSRDRARLLTAHSKGPREEQQDSSIGLQSAEHGTALLVVADGVGGKSGGRLASQKVIEVARLWWEERGGLFSDPAPELSALCHRAHEQINEEGHKHGISPRTTVVALYLTPTHAHWVHSGDSRLYHFRSGELLSRTADHSVLELMVERGLVKEEDMGSHPDQGTLMQSLGGEEFIDPSADQAEITPDDAFLLCTDGFWERTPVEEMAALLGAPRAQAPERAAQAVDHAVERNGPKGDNVTVALALPAREALAAAPERSGSLLTGLLASLFVLLSVAALLWFPTGKKPAAPAATARPQSVETPAPSRNAEPPKEEVREGPRPVQESTPHPSKAREATHPAPPPGPVPMKPFYEKATPPPGPVN
jgi:serine/threonine protein phosphatase PrpC